MRNDPHLNLLISSGSHRFSAGSQRLTAAAGEREARGEVGKKTSIDLVAGADPDSCSEPAPTSPSHSLQAPADGEEPKKIKR